MRNPSGGGYRLTEAGIVAWAIMNEHVLFSHDSIQRNQYGDNELRKVIEDMTQLSDDSRHVLEQLIEHEEGIARSEFTTSLSALVRYGHIREDGGLLFITESGKRVLNGPPSKPASPRIPSTRKGLKNTNAHAYNGTLAHSDITGSSDMRADMVIDDALARKRPLPAPFAPVVKTELERTVQAMSKDTCAIDCEKCLKARVLDMVAEKLPEVRDLLEAVRAQDEAKYAQDAILKAIGK